MQNRDIYFISLTFITLFLISGCAKTVEQTIYLGNTEVYAPVTPPPTHININRNSGSLILSPKFIINTATNIDGRTEDRYSPGIIPSDTLSYPTKDKNLTWNFPQVLIGLDADLALTKSFGFFGGIQYSNSKQKDLWGGNFGIGLFSRGTNSVMRFDAGFVYQQYYFNAATIVHTKVKDWNNTTKEYTSYFLDVDKQVNLNPFLTFTINTSNSDNPFNYFFTLGYFTQNLLNFEPGKTGHFPFSYNPNVITRDLRADCTAAFLLLNPGVLFKFDDQVQINFSIKILKEFQIEPISQNWFLLPSFQMDWAL